MTPGDVSLIAGASALAAGAMKFILDLREIKSATAETSAGDQIADSPEAVTMKPGASRIPPEEEQQSLGS